MNSLSRSRGVRWPIAAWIGMGLLALAGCSNAPATGTTSALDGVPEIQGIWRYSEGAGVQWLRSTTFEFTGSRFQVHGQPAMLARGHYQVLSQQNGVYRLGLDAEYEEHFDVKNLEVSVAPKGLLIDRKLYRRIVRQ